ncbi:unnamed protein product [Paramecium primaurelia]|uniref:Protein kinase domain-containing protein n=1 Tax=Paramecium primaurelia TaxID=5886 RepID=A0A8S1NJN9_PARPR|nr:unnamed protein product [Paramecium primaurelia]
MENSWKIQRLPQGIVAATYFRQILLAIIYGHEKYIVHRDLKPVDVSFVNQPEFIVKAISVDKS